LDHAGAATKVVAAGLGQTSAGGGCEASGGAERGFAFICIVQQAGVHMTCVRAGTEALQRAVAAAKVAGGQGRTSAGGQGGSSAPCARVHTRTHLGGGWRLTRGRQRIG
jgi:hypothetical protein